MPTCLVPGIKRYVFKSYKGNRRYLISRKWLSLSFFHKEWNYKKQLLRLRLFEESPTAMSPCCHLYTGHWTSNLDTCTWVRIPVALDQCFVFHCFKFTYFTNYNSWHKVLCGGGKKVFPCYVSVVVI